MHSRAATSLRDLLLASDFGRAHPRRVDELLALCAGSLIQDDTPQLSQSPQPASARHSDDLPLPERAA